MRLFVDRCQWWLKKIVKKRVLYRVSFEMGSVTDFYGVSRIEYWNLCTFGYFYEPFRVKITLVAYLISSGIKRSRTFSTCEARTALFHKTTRFISAPNLPNNTTSLSTSGICQTNTQLQQNYITIRARFITRTPHGLLVYHPCLERWVYG